MKILLVEDEVKLSSVIKKGLEEHRYHVVPAYDGNSGLSLYKQEDYDLIILDIVMPGMSGLELCMQIKEMDKNYPPILMLTALGTTEDVVSGLNAGADDYLAKPFRFKELLARINALKRRGRVIKQPDKILVAGDLELNTKSKEVKRSEKIIELTALEFKLLEYLLRNKNRVVSKIDILEHVWEDNIDLTTNVVEVYINYLRNKVDRNYPEKLIKTIIGMGYAIKEP